MNVLFVCIGNQGRSVMAERLFRELVAGRHESALSGEPAGRCYSSGRPGGAR